MAKVLKTDVPEAGLAKQFFEVARFDRVHIWEVAFLICENPFWDLVPSLLEPFFVAPLPKLSQCGKKLV